MPEKKYPPNSSVLVWATLGSMVCAFIVFAVVTGLFKNREVKAWNLKTAQEKKPQGTVPVQFENNSQLPAAITDAYLEVGERRETAVKFPGRTPDSDKPTLPEMIDVRRDLRFHAKIVNQSTYPITQLRLAIENPSFLPNQIITIICRLSGGAEKAVSKNNGLNPNDLFNFSRRMSFEDKKNGQELVNHVSDFRLKVIGVSYSSEDDQIWLQSFLTDYDEEGMIVSQSMKDFKDTPRLKYLEALRQTPQYREALKQAQESGKDGQLNHAMILSSTIYGDPRSNQVGAQRGASSDRAADETVHPMSSLLRPTILYKEKAVYTQEARDNKVQGTVVLNVTFTLDERITDIRVVRGLPHGLTEKAIEAAQKIRFKAAMKDGQPVSVRGNLEFTFNPY
jgi:TonB family protein